MPKYGAEIYETQDEQHMNRIEFKEPKTRTRYILKMKLEWKWNGKR